MAFSAIGSSGQQGIYLARPAVTAVSPAKVWVGIGSSASLGIKFDLRAKVHVDNTLVGSGHVNSVPGGFNISSHFARLTSIPLALVNGPVAAPTGSVLTLRVLVRNACSGSLKSSGTARLWYDGRKHDTASRFGATIADVSGNYFLRGGFELGTTAGTAHTSVDAAVGTECGPFVPFGTWSMTLP